MLCISEKHSDYKTDIGCGLNIYYIFVVIRGCLLMFMRKNMQLDSGLKEIL